MPVYAAFGTCLDTDVELPGLRATVPRGRRWTVRTDVGAPRPPGGVALGREAYASCERTLHGAPTALVYRHSCTGTFGIAPVARRVTWWPAPHAHPDSVGGDLVGRVLALALHAEGRLCLHASAVTVGGAVVAFLATKGTGKSTLAAAMVNAGASLLSDDMLAVDVHGRDGVRALPGLDTLRLHGDAAERLCGASTPHRIGADGKRVLAGLAGLDGLAVPAPPRRRPIAALYLLHAAPADAPDVERTPLPGTRAVVALLPHVKVGLLLGAGGAGGVLAQLATLTAAVPVLRLDVPRRLDRVDMVAARVAAWHTRSPAGDGAAGRGARDGAVRRADAQRCTAW